MLLPCRKPLTRRYVQNATYDGNEIVQCSVYMLTSIAYRSSDYEAMRWSNGRHNYAQHSGCKRIAPKQDDGNKRERRYCSSYAFVI